MISMMVVALKFGFFPLVFAGCEFSGRSTNCDGHIYLSGACTFRTPGYRLLPF